MLFRDTVQLYSSDGSTAIGDEFSCNISVARPLPRILMPYMQEIAVETHIATIPASKSAVCLKDRLLKDTRFEQWLRIVEGQENRSDQLKTTATLKLCEEMFPTN